MHAEAQNTQSGEEVRGRAPTLPQRPQRLCVHLWIGLALLSLAGCTQASHQSDKIAAQRNWNEVRAKVKCQLARQQLAAGAIDEAIRTAEEALSLDPSVPEPFVVAAQGYVDKGEWASARRIIDLGEKIGIATDAGPPAAAKKSPAVVAGWAELLYLRGVIAERLGHFDEASAAYARARSMAPSVVDYLAAHVECLVAGGRPEEARRLLSEDGAKYDRDGTIEVLSAQVALLLGDEVSAAAHLRSAMDLVNDESIVSGRYGTLLSKVGRHAEAVAVLRPLISRNEADAPASQVRSLASSQLALGQFDDAKRVLFARVRSNPDEAWSWLLLARAAIGQGDLPTTRRCAGELRRLRPDDTQSRLIDGYVNWKEGDLPSAERSLKACLTVQPRDSLALCLMAEVLNQDGRIESACQHFRRALQIEPSCRWARLRLAELDAQRNPAFSSGKRLFGQATK